MSPPGFILELPVSAAPGEGVEWASLPVPEEERDARDQRRPAGLEVEGEECPRRRVTTD